MKKIFFSTVAYKLTSWIFFKFEKVMKISEFKTFINLICKTLFMMKQPTAEHISVQIPYSIVYVCFQNLPHEPTFCIILLS